MLAAKVGFVSSSEPDAAAALAESRDRDVLPRSRRLRFEHGRNAATGGKHGTRRCASTRGGCAGSVVCKRRHAEGLAALREKRPPAFSGELG